MLTFQKPHPLLLECSKICNLIMEWSVLYPGNMSALTVLQNVVWFTWKKSSLQWTSGFSCHYVNLELSRFKTLHASIKSRFTDKSFITSSDFLWDLARPLFLSLSKFSARLKFPPTIISSQLKSSSWLKTEVKKFGSSSFGAYIFAKDMCFPFVIRSHLWIVPWDRCKLSRAENWNYC